VQRWEYHTERVEMSVRVLATLDEDLNGAGQDGWELVSVVPTNWVSASPGPPSSTSFVSEVLLWFRRPKHD
jgi:hypothetical protein